MQRNLPGLRARISKDLNDIKEGNATVLTCKTIVVGPKTHTPVPGQFVISDGTYAQNFFTIKGTGTDPVLGIPASLTSETVSAYAARNGLIPGDIYTLCAFTPDVESDPVWIGVDESGQYASEICYAQNPCFFQFIRMQVKDVTADTSAIGTVTAAGVLSKLFTLTAYVDNGAGQYLALNMPTDATFKCADSASAESVSEATTLGYNFSIGSFGMIRSRLDQDLRSKTVMQTFYNSSVQSQLGVLDCGISSGAALIQWKKGVEALGSSELILESNS